MGIYTVQGFRPYSMTAKDTGELIEGMTVFCSFEDENITGSGVEKLSISKKKMGEFVPQIGQQIIPIYNKYGKVEGISVPK